MKLRRYTMHLNQQIADTTYGVFRAIGDGMHWIGPFMPWVAGAAVLYALMSISP